MTSETYQWVRDEPKTRELDGKTLKITSKDERDGIYVMHVSETAPDGTMNAGHVVVSVVPIEQDFMQ